MQLNWRVHAVALACLITGLFPQQAAMIASFKALIASTQCLPSAQVAFFVRAVRPNAMLTEIVIDHQLKKNKINYQIKFKKK
jgi:hypothetical protein